MPNATQAFNNYAGMEPAFEQAIFGSQREQKKQTEIGAEATMAEARAKGEGLRLEAEAGVRAQDLQADILKYTGLDFQNPDAAINKERAKEATARAQREALAAEITSRQGASLFSDPGTWLSNIIELPGMIAQHNNLATLENSAGAAIADMQVVATNLEKLTTAKTQDLLRAKAVSDSEAIVQQATAVTAALRSANSAGEAKAILDVMNQRHNIFSGVFAMQEHADSMAMQQANLKQRKEEFELTRADKLERDKEKAEALKGDTAIVTGINLLRAQIRGPGEKEMTLQDVKMMPAEEKKYWYGAVKRMNYGNDYATAIPAMDAVGDLQGAWNANNKAMMQQVVSLKQDAEKRARDIQNKADQTPGASKVPWNQALHQAYGDLYKRDSIYAAAGSNKTDLSADSPLAIDFEAIGKGAIASKNPSFIGKILANAVQRNPNVSITGSYNASDLTADVQAAVNAGTISPQEAGVELARFMALSSADAYIKSGVRNLGLSQPTDWYVTPKGAKGDYKLDLTNPTAVENFFMFSKKRQFSQTVQFNPDALFWSAGNMSKPQNIKDPAKDKK